MGSLWHQDTGPTQNPKQESRKGMDSDPYCITNMDPKARKHTSVQCCGSGPFSQTKRTDSGSALILPEFNNNMVVANKGLSNTENINCLETESREFSWGP